MKRKITWVVVSCLMVLALVMAACGPAAAPATPITPTTPTTPVTPTAPTTPATPAEKEAAKPAPEAPKYGGTLTLFTSGDIYRWDAILHPVGSPTIDLTNQSLWSGDWTKGPAGGYGSYESDWGGNNYNFFGNKAGYVAESTKWTADAAKNEGTIIYQIRRGIRWALNPASEASRLVNGRELTADDVVHSLKRSITQERAGTARADLYYRHPELRSANITKTGPWEVTVKIPLTGLMVAVDRFGNSTAMQPPEVIAKYGDMGNWRNSVGTGPFIIIDYVGGSQAILDRNPNFWMKDPIGPGKDNQLPYLDRVRYLVIPDRSTRFAAMWTGKLDQLNDIGWEDVVQFKKTAPELKELKWPGTRLGAVGINTKLPKFQDARVRRAMMMAIDYDAINQSLHAGLGNPVTWPVSYFSDYSGLYVALDAPDFPASAKELYTYNPDKARQLLSEAGYPKGFKTKIMLESSDIDYFSVWKDMWSKVGIDLEFVVRDSATIRNMRISGDYELMIGGGADAPVYLGSAFLQGDTDGNISMLDDPIINKALDEVRLVAATKGEPEALKVYRELVKYILPQAYAIPRHKVPLSNFWWPWLKNYSGEMYVGYSDINWPQWVWIDQPLKKSMGY